MEYVNLGSTGLKVSRICLGTMSFGSSLWRDWVLEEEAARPIIKRALELGINFFDTADMYSNGMSEEVLGRALGKFKKREEVVIATKVFHPTGNSVNERGLSRGHIMNAVNASLERLETDYIDLYQIHRWDPDCPIDETLEALHDIVKSGKVRYIGASNMYAWQFARALYRADLNHWTRFVSMQNHYNLLYREEEREMLPLCKEERIAYLPWSPLARGVLAGNRLRGGTKKTTRATKDSFSHETYKSDSDFDVVDRVVDLAQRKGVTSAQIALAWLLHQTTVTAPVIGTTSRDHVEAAVASLSISLSDDESEYLEEIYKPHNILGFQ